MKNCNTVSTMEQIEGADGKSSEKILRGREGRFLVNSRAAGAVLNAQSLSCV